MGSLIAAWLDIRSKPVRTIAAIAGMIAAVTAVVLVDAAAILSQQANDEYIARTWGRPATISITFADGAPEAMDDRILLADRLRSTLDANGVDLVTPDNEVGMALRLGDVTATTYATWVSPDYAAVSFMDLLAGDLPRVTARSDVLHAVMSIGLAQRLGFTGADAVGRTVAWAPAEGILPDFRTAITQPLVIDGVARTLGTTTSPDDLLIVSDLDLTQRVATRFPSWLAHVQPDDIVALDQLVRSVTVQPGSVLAFQTRRIDQADQLAPVLNQQRTTANAVTVVALVVGGLGILGTGLSAVRERGREFGLRRALGASTRRIFAGVVLQTMLEVMLAVVVAVPLSAILLDLFTRDLILSTLPMPSDTSLPIASAVRGAVAALLVGVLAGLLPAIRAARTSVVQALRD